MKETELYTPWNLRGIELLSNSRLGLARNLARLVMSSKVTEICVQTLDEASGEYALLLSGTLEPQTTKAT